jgi:hypothetical protein
MTQTIDLPDAKLGNTLLQKFQLLNKADKTPIAQAGKRYTFTLKLNTATDDAQAEVFVDYTVPAGADADAGIFVIRIEKSITAALKPTQYKYELNEIQAAGAGESEDTLITIYDGTLRFTH